MYARPFLRYQKAQIFLSSHLLPCSNFLRIASRSVCERDMATSTATKKLLLLLKPLDKLPAHGSVTTRPRVRNFPFYSSQFDLGSTFCRLNCQFTCSFKFWLFFSSSNVIGKQQLCCVKLLSWRHDAWYERKNAKFKGICPQKLELNGSI